MKQKPKFIFTYEEVGISELGNEFFLTIYPQISRELGTQIEKYIMNSNIYDTSLETLEIIDNHFFIITHSKKPLTQKYKHELFKYLKSIGGIKKNIKYDKKCDFDKPYDWNRNVHGSVLLPFQVPKIHVMDKFVNIKEHHIFDRTNTDFDDIHKILHYLDAHHYIDIIPVENDNIMILTKVGNRVINYMFEYHYDDDDDY